MKTRVTLSQLTKLTLLLGFLLTFFSVLSPKRPEFQRPAEQIGKYDARILRDSWGVPHIFGVTDADAAYGLAYAHAEDDFVTIQENILAARGQLATLQGAKGATNDYVVSLLKIWPRVMAQYESELSPDVRAVCEGYAAGLNHFAAVHPDAVLPHLFPITGQDIVAGFVVRTPSFYGLDKTLKKLLPLSTGQRGDAGPNQSRILREEAAESLVGSNAFAISPARSEKGETFLAINSHQPWQGPVAWYEAHVHSESGWDMVGGVFPGTPLVLQGHNHDLGWALTVNHPDLVDVYELEINPEDPKQYKMDDEWRDLVVDSTELRIKVVGPVSKTVKREVLASVHGPVLRTDQGTYAVRYAGMDEIRQVEQWFRMNKAHTFSGFYSALKMQAIPSLNIIYGDKEGNIFYLYNAELPVRDPAYDWSRNLPGNSSATLWKEIMPLEDLPQVLNPRSGFLLNCNSSAFNVTAGPENPRRYDYSETLGIDTYLTNRARRLLTLLSADDSISSQEFYRYKYDLAYDPESSMGRYVARLLQLKPPARPLVRKAFELLRHWDLKTDEENTGAALAVLTFQPFLEKGIRDADGQDLIDALTHAAGLLQKNHGRLDVPWRTINRLMHGGLDLGLAGGPGVLHAIDGKLVRGGRLKAYAGDSYILMVTWDSAGEVHSSSIHPYGAATAHPDSPHYSDQSILFSQRKFKPVWLNERDIRENLEKEYRPGEEMLGRPPEYLTLK